MALWAFHGRLKDYARHPVKGESKKRRADQRERNQNEMRDRKKDTEDRSAPAKSQGFECAAQARLL